MRPRRFLGRAAGVASLIAVVGLTACGSNDPPAPNTAYAFPHPADFGDGEEHGPAWRTAPDGCVRCHFPPQAAPTARRCDECHPTYPHAEGYAQASAHGADGQDGGMACVDCHGTGERRPCDVEGSACRDCHLHYPHRQTWPLPAIHGQPVLDHGVAVCGSCHGDDHGGSTLTGGCLDCHPLYPHQEGYDQGDVHGPISLEQGARSCASSCHGDDWEGGGSGVACADCHPPYPHADGYGSAHQEDAVELGEEACLACHDDDPGFPANFTCATVCHGGGTPHVRTR